MGRTFHAEAHAILHITFFQQQRLRTDAPWPTLQIDVRASGSETAVDSKQGFSPVDAVIKKADAYPLREGVVALSESMADLAL